MMHSEFPALEKPAILARLKSKELGHFLEIYEQVDSTNNEAKTAAIQGCAHGLTIVAERQSAGRGRRGRIWTSPSAGDLYFSMVWKKPIAQAHLPLATLCTGLGVAEAFEVLHALPVQIKWPNDILIAHKKCAGILVEGLGRGEATDALVIGIGINVHRRNFAEELSQQATSLALQISDSSTLDRSAVLCEVLERVELWLEQLCLGETTVIIDAMQKRLAWRGSQVDCDGVQGQIEGLNERGALLLRSESGLTAVFSGTVRLCNPP